ncbi:hypothetical protein DM860_017027 [Cuscuta australis]|uniref:Uncharacterized protein n=1 Tax=Cuscuta australis TaxID=267555 RepID=A0A328DND2_9ASTE|nr:hypothetical protein DM860_017027 [Cuscuta australis]
MLYSYSGDVWGEEEGGGRGRAGAFNFNGPSTKQQQGGDGGFAAATNPETKRKKRIASYKLLATEGKVKSTLRGSVKWFKSKFTDLRYGPF